jgi:transcriptional regulator
MRHNPQYASEDVEVLKDLIRHNPWATVVSNHEGSLVASHYPILLEEEVPEPTIVSHVGRPDERLHGLGEHEIMLIVQGHHGYISPSWYAPGASQVPTWNFTAAHCYGVPQLLDEEENLRVLARLVDHFERRVERPLLLERGWAAPIAKGTVGFRLAITRFICKVKLSQDKDELTRRQVIAALREPGPYQHPQLADEMHDALAGALRGT